MTKELLIEWLKSESSIRCILMEVGVQVGGVEVTRYLSTKTYVTKPNESPANTEYIPAIAGGVRFTESLSLDGSPSLSYGDVELYNVSGERDTWLDDVWTGRPIKMFVGDVRWNRADFYQIFEGVVVGVDCRRRDRINIKLSDKLQRLNTPVTEVKLGGTTTNKDRVLPLCFGECHNIEPLLVDPAQHEYQIHDGAIERIIEVRDNGVPVSFTPFLSTGKFRLDQSPVGTITCSVQGDKPSTYTDKIVPIVKRIVKSFGQVSQRFTDADLDLTSLSAFDSTNQQSVGIYLNDRANVLDVCNKLATSVGARVAMKRNGLMHLVKIHLPRSDLGTSVGTGDMTQFSLSVSSMPPIVAGIKLGYCKNWAVQNSLQTGIPAAHIDLFAQEWLTATAIDLVIAAAHKINTEPVMAETLLLTEADANAEAARRLGVFNVQRRMMKYQGLPHLMLEQVGDSQTLTSPRFGLENGKTGQVMSLTTDWLNNHVETEVLV